MMSEILTGQDCINILTTYFDDDSEYFGVEELILHNILAEHGASTVTDDILLNIRYVSVSDFVNSAFTWSNAVHKNNDWWFRFSETLSDLEDDYESYFWAIVEDYLLDNYSSKVIIEEDGDYDA